MSFKISNLNKNQKTIYQSYIVKKYRVILKNKQNSKLKVIIKIKKILMIFINIQIILNSLQEINLINLDN